MIDFSFFFLRFALLARYWCVCAFVRLCVCAFVRLCVCVLLLYRRFARQATRRYARAKTGGDVRYTTMKTAPPPTPSKKKKSQKNKIETGEITNRNNSYRTQIFVLKKKKKKIKKPDATNKKGKNEPKKKKEKEVARSGYQHQKRSGRLSGHLHFDGWWCRVLRGQLNPDQLNATVVGYSYGGATVVPSVVVRRWCCRGVLLLRCCCCSWCSTCDTHKNQRVCKSTSIKRFWSRSAATWPTYTQTHTHTHALV